MESTVGVLHPATKFLNCTQDNCLFQHVSSPTRFREGQTPSCLDLVFTNEENVVDTDSLIIDSSLGKSDHTVIHFDYVCSACNTSIDDTEKFQFFKGKYNLMSDELSDIDWDTLFENKNVEKMWNIFKSKLHNSMENHIPKRRHDRWMDKNAKLAIINKQRAWRKYKYSRTRASYIDCVK